MNPAVSCLWSCSSRVARAAAQRCLGLACAIALALFASGAGAQENVPRFGPGAIAFTQAAQGDGSRSARLEGESTGAAQDTVTASTNPQGSTPSDPEPQTWALMGAALLAAAMIRRRMERR